MEFSIAETITDFDDDAWDALVGVDDPFSRHGFLNALEQSGSVGPESGWLPQIAAVHEDDRLIAALPLYAKAHSFGEYIFDWSWAEASERAGLSYYPKLVAMVPFSPVCPQNRILTQGAAHDDNSREASLLLLHKLKELVLATDTFSSLHLNYLSQDDLTLTQETGFLPRSTLQFHWHNPGYNSFEDFLSELNRKARKEIKRERRRVQEQRISIKMLRGDDMSDDDWAFVAKVYDHTSRRKWGNAYLRPSFFTEQHHLYSNNVRVFIAYREKQRIAATLNFVSGGVLCGRYWGAVEAIDCLHFELCYYQLIEYAIAHKLHKVEAGAQGEHKIQRGFLPAKIRSAHLLREPKLHHAVAQALSFENAQIDAILAREDIGPYRTTTWTIGPKTDLLYLEKAR